MTYNEKVNENRTALEELQKPVPSGERGNERILSDLQVKDILLDDRINRLIADEYGVSLSLIKRIKARTASYFQNRSETNKLMFEPNMDLVTLPIVAAPVGPPVKLDEDDVERIRNDDRKLKDIAEDLGVSISTVWRAKNGDYQGRSKAHKKTDRVAGSIDSKPIYESELRKRRGSQS